MSDLVTRITTARSDLALKAPCRVTTTGNITLSGFQTIDGVTLASGDSNLRVLVKNQTNSAQNGIYLAQSGAWMRDKDLDESFTTPGSVVVGDAMNGLRVYVQQGTVGSGIVYTLSATDPIIIGTTALSFVPDTEFLNAGIECAFDGGGLPLLVGMNGLIECPFAGAIVSGTLIADAIDNLTVDVRKCTYAQYDAGTTHPVAADTITGSSPLILQNALLWGGADLRWGGIVLGWGASGVKYQDTTLIGWTAAVAQGDVLQFIVTAAGTTISKATATLRIMRQH